MLFFVRIVILRIFSFVKFEEFKRKKICLKEDFFMKFYFIIFFVILLMLFWFLYISFYYINRMYCYFYNSYIFSGVSRVVIGNFFG